MNAIVENKSFEEKMKDRIKESIGDLIGDDDLKKLLDAAMHDVFFKPSKIKINSYDYKDGPSYLQAIVKELLEEKVRECIKEYIDNNTEEVEKVINDVLQEGIGKCIMSAIATMFQSQFMMFQNNITNQLHNKGIY